MARIIDPPPGVTYCIHTPQYDANFHIRRKNNVRLPQKYHLNLINTHFTSLGCACAVFKEQ